MDPLIGLGESKANGASASICYHAKNLDVVGRYQPGSLERLKMTVCASVLTAFAPLVESAVVETCRKETGPSMTPEERERMMYLCKRIQEEPEDPRKIHGTNRGIERFAGTQGTPSRSEGNGANRLAPQHTTGP